MKLHEYQTKFRFAEFGIPIPQGEVVDTPEAARAAAEAIGGPVVVKAQVQVAGRGKAGGVKLAQTPDEAAEKADEILGMDLKGYEVKQVLIDPAADLAEELYLAITTDRGARRTVMIASAEGGVDIEEVNRETPEKILRIHIDPFLGLQTFQTVHIASFLGLPRDSWNAFGKIARGLYNCYIESDASLAEINPLVRQSDGSLIAVDGKMIIDDSALFRQPEMAEKRDTAYEADAETAAREADLAYVKLDGTIGCMVNGAGLAMTTLDVINLFGGEPANFLDTAGGANAEKVEKAMNIILTDPNVKAVLINIFGGITRGDEVARGIVTAIDAIKPEVPIVVRLVGTNCPGLLTPGEAKVGFIPGNIAKPGPVGVVSRS
ncbi:MAG: ADP-forming succinate--CoA ligase subunit beta, partial [Chloroflexi bacterium]|nr:ADP-forming succinate--CoA ligase subunit beta [Chloroflexota bacterium]